MTDEKLILPEDGSAMVAAREELPKLEWIARSTKTMVSTGMIESSRQLWEI